MRSNHFKKTVLCAAMFLAFLAALTGCGNAAPTAIKASDAEVGLPSLVKQVKVNVKTDCGAKGDGTTNDTAAFQKAAQMLEAKGGGTLIIPQGTYTVGEQPHVAGQYPYYQKTPIFSVRKLNGLLIEGNDATLRIAPQLHYGTFDKDSGEVYAHQMPFLNTGYAAQIGAMIEVRDSHNIVIRNLELDGNLSHLILGGPFGDTGWQLGADGLILYGNTNVRLDKVNAHHHARDGIMIGYTWLKENDPTTPYVLTDCSFEYNGRQGLSWVGGIGLKAYRCKFNHTGKALNNGTPLYSKPGAGLDIEAENSITRQGYFESCEFVDNTGPGMVSDTGNGGYSTFRSCTFWGTTNWSMWANKPGLKFEGCKIYGSAVHVHGDADPALATQWSNCTFEDKSWVNGKVYHGNSAKFLLELNGNMQNVKVTNCTFIANTCKAIWVSASADGRITFDGCTVITRKTDLSKEDGTWQAIFGNANFIGCHFKGDFGAAATGRWGIIARNARIAADPPTVVEGPNLVWSGGLTGVLPAQQPSPLATK
jgi:hypothetical protein